MSTDAKAPGERDVSGADDLKDDGIGVSSGMDENGWQVYLGISLAINHQRWMGVDVNSGRPKNSPAMGKGCVTDQ